MSSLPFPPFRVYLYIFILVNQGEISFENVIRIQRLQFPLGGWNSCSLIVKLIKSRSVLRFSKSHTSHSLGMGKIAKL